MKNAKRYAKRFYKTVAIDHVPEGHALLLDRKPAFTPKRRPLVVSSAALAEAIKTEWEAQEQNIAPDTMPLTQLSIIAIDVVADAREALVADLASYAETDLLCYRAEEKDAAEAQDNEWSKPLQWAMQRFDVHFEITRGIMHVKQPDMTVLRLQQSVQTLGDWPLAACSVLVRATGSLVLSLALIENAFPPEKIARWSRLDEDLQTARWGSDEEKNTRLHAMESEIIAAYKFVKLLKNNK